MTTRSFLARYRLATPTFIGGGPGTPPEVRPPSFKGVLRFWWRALAWNAYEGRHDEIQSAERKLFGSTEQQALARLDVRASQRPAPKMSSEAKRTSGMAYLAGQGLVHFRDGWRREAIAAGHQFTVRLRVAARAEAKAVELLEHALELVGYVGGLGSRSRKGFGSLVLEELEVDGSVRPLACDAEAIAQRLRGIVFAGSGSDQAPEYTAFSRASHLLVLEQSGTATDFLSSVGDDFLRFRSYGKDGRDASGRDAERNFPGDHDLAMSVAQGEAASKAPQRVAFGLPHNYYSTNWGKLDVGPASHERRATPLFFHFLDGGPKALCVVAFLPARFLPNGEKISLSPKGRKQEVPVPQELWEPIAQYLARLRGGGKDHRFHCTSEVHG